LRLASRHCCVPAHAITSSDSFGQCLMTSLGLAAANRSKCWIQDNPATRRTFRGDIYGNRNGLFFRSSHSENSGVGARRSPRTAASHGGAQASEPQKQDAKRKWKGHGFNLIWRPKFDGEFGPKKFVLTKNWTSPKSPVQESPTGHSSNTPSRLVGLPIPRRSRTASTSRASILSPGFGLMCHKRPIQKSHRQLSAWDRFPTERLSICKARQHIRWRRSQHSIRRVSRRSLLATQTTARPPLFLTLTKRILARTTT
jgi:hypothetical protein